MIDRLGAEFAERYRIERELGGGGMSRVFLATETRLDRPVVIKLLSPALAAGISAERFTREIKVAAALQEPHIVPLLADGVTSDGLPWYTMPFVPGPSLRQRLAEGRVPLGESVGILRDIARALAFAHSHGVVHRDIKPENVLLHEGIAVVTDFGIAKALSVSRARDTDSTSAIALTETGTSLGTPAYMAPEQAVGDEVDQRSDLYSWGVIAYELLAGAHPFAGRVSAQQLVAAHVTETPRPLVDATPGVPERLSAIVMGCLEKRPEARPQTANEILRALDELTTLTPTGARKSWAARPPALLVAAAVAAVAITLVVSQRAMPRTAAPAVEGSTQHAIAVLPFENESGDTSYAYFAEGLSDELRGQLAAIPGLSVKARTSSAQFRGRAVDPRTVGEKLGVGVLLTGVVRRSPTRVQVTAELANASSGDAIWSQTFDEELRDLPLVRDSITQRIAAALRLRLGEGKGKAERGTSDFEAYDLFLKGQFAYRRFDYVRAAGYFARAVQRDPTFARAHAALTVAYAFIPTSGVGSPDSARALARSSLARTLALDPRSPHARFADAIVRFGEFRLMESEHILAALVAEHPDDDEVLFEHVLALGMLGHLPEAQRAAEAARRLDPLNPGAEVTLQYVFTMLGQYREAIDAGRRALELDPRNLFALGNQGVSYAFVGQPDSAVAALEAATRLDSTAFGTRPMLAFTYASAGRWDDVARLRERSRADTRGNSPDLERLIFAVIEGDLTTGMKALERGLAMRQPAFLTFSFSCDPMLARLRALPRMAELAQEYGARTCPRVERWPIPPRRTTS